MKRTSKPLILLWTLGLEISNPDYVSGKKEAKTLEDLTFVITGTLPKPRKEVEDLIELRGGHVTSAISASTDYLVVGEDPGSKLRKAQTLKVKTISYEELLKLIEKRKSVNGFRIKYPTPASYRLCSSHSVLHSNPS